VTCTHSYILSNGACYYCDDPARQCEHPDHSDGYLVVAQSVPSQTGYEWDGTGEDPNRALWLCADHGEEYTEIMNDQWASYYGGLL